jgi:hypothetical protein
MVAEGLVQVILQPLTCSVQGLGVPGEMEVRGRWLRKAAFVRLSGGTAAAVQGAPAGGHGAHAGSGACIVEPAGADLRCICPRNMCLSQGVRQMAAQSSLYLAFWESSHDGARRTCWRAWCACWLRHCFSTLQLVTCSVHVLGRPSESEV